MKTYEEIVKDFTSWSQHDEDILKKEVIEILKKLEKDEEQFYSEDWMKAQDFIIHFFGINEEDTK